MSSFDTLGTLLAEIANLMVEGIRIFSLADKRLWGPDEHDQAHALQTTLNRAKKDFQHLCPLVNGQAQYEHDRTYESIRQLRSLRSRFAAHVRQLKDWSRSGGPINPVWIRKTQALQQELHRAQCRAAGRIFISLHESSQRCLGAFLVRRAHQIVASRAMQGQITEEMVRKTQLEELGACKQTGSFERFEEDVAFICDFCDGHLMWKDLEGVPTGRTPPYMPTGRANEAQWQATGLTASGAEEKQVIFAPVVVANHVVPRHGDWMAKLTCPFCEEESRQPQDEDDDEASYRPDDVFDDVAELQEHLEWQHAGNGSVAGGGPLGVVPASNNCSVM